MARRPTKATDVENEGDPDDQEPEKPDDTNEGDGKPDSGDNGLEGRIRDIVREVVGPLLESGARGAHRVADDEDDTTRRVRAALDKLKAEDERDSRVKKVEETLQKVTERPPARTGLSGKLQRIMWGTDE